LPLLAALRFLSTKRKKKEKEMAQNKNEARKGPGGWQDNHPQQRNTVIGGKVQPGTIGDKAPSPAKVRPQSETDMSDVEMPAGTGLDDKRQFGM
jgi:hypothetical protein